jgi:hypothetical protein
MMFFRNTIEGWSGIGKRASGSGPTDKAEPPGDPARDKGEGARARGQRRSGLALGRARQWITSGDLRVEGGACSRKLGGCELS